MTFWDFCFVMVLIYYRKAIGEFLLYCFVLLGGTDEQLKQFQKSRKEK